MNGNPLNSIEQFQLTVNEFLGGLTHQLSSTSSTIALGMGMF